MIIALCVPVIENPGKSSFERRQDSSTSLDVAPLARTMLPLSTDMMTTWVNDYVTFGARIMPQVSIGLLYFRLQYTAVFDYTVQI